MCLFKQKKKIPRYFNFLYIFPTGSFTNVPQGYEKVNKRG